MNKDTGGPAFPMSGFDMRHGQPVQAVYQHGMTLRDYFAAKAMQGYLADENWRAEVSPMGTAEAAYRAADAMLRRRGT